MKPTGLNSYKANLLDRPSVHSTWCPVCGDRATDEHHVIQKGMGGVSKELEKRIPIIDLCRTCHQLYHARKLHFQWDGRWKYFYSGQQMKDEDAWELYRKHYSPLQQPVEHTIFGAKK